MNNFFFNTSLYPLFKKALKSTEKEPVVINILSTDSSLQKKETKVSESAAPRKNMSRKYEPSPFGRFFGPRKQQPVSVDMKDFSSWKNKNYRKAEESIQDEEFTSSKFSLSDFMNDKSQTKFNELDQTRSDMQKPINQLSTDDPLYKKFSLDSYMHKLEEQTLVKNEFEENDDILEPLGSQTQSVVPDSSQDENFGFGLNSSVEKFALDDPISGDSFKFEQEELDKFRARLDKMEREAANIKEKSNEKVITGNDLSAISGFNINNLTEESDEESENSMLIDDIESVNAKFGVDSSELKEKKEKTVSQGKRFIEINRTETDSSDNSDSEVAKFDNEIDFVESDEESENRATNLIDSFDNDEEDVNDSQENIESADESVADDEFADDENIVQDEDSTNVDSNIDDENIVISDDIGSELNNDDESIEVDSENNNQESNINKMTKISRSDIVTKDDLKSMSEELIGKFTELYKKGDESDEAGFIAEDPYQIQGRNGINPMYPDSNTGYIPQTPYGMGTQQMTDDASLRLQLQELINTNKRLDLEKEERLRQAELEKERVAAEYESRIKEMEQSFKQNYEDFKKQAYLDKLDRDIKLKEAESKFKKKTVEIKEQEKDTYKRERTGAMLRKELKSHLNIANLEMDKKLLEVASHLNKDQFDRLNAENIEMAKRLENEELKAREDEEVESVVEEEIDEIEEEEEESPKKTTTKKTTRKRKTASRTTPARRGARRTSRRRIDSDIIGGIDFE